MFTKLYFGVTIFIGSVNFFYDILDSGHDNSSIIFNCGGSDGVVNHLKWKEDHERAKEFQKAKANNLINKEQ